jgi:hypothetical protein
MADNDEDNEERYEWSSNGGCERCDAMDGHLCEEEPPRPHPHCDCTIISRSKPSRTCDASDVQYSVQHSGNIHHGSGLDLDEEFDIVFDYTIECWGGAQTLSGEVFVSRTYRECQGTDSADLLEDALAEALEEVEEIAVEECPVCGEHPHVS